MADLPAMIANVVLMLPDLPATIHTSAPVTLPPHECNISLPVVNFLSCLLLLLAHVHFHCVWCSGDGWLRWVVQQLPSFFSLLLAHLLIQNLGSLPQFCQGPNKAVQDGQVVFDVLIGSIIEPGTVIGI